MTNRRNNLGYSSTKYLKPIGIGILSGLSTCSLLLIFIAFIFTKSSNPPHSVVDPMMLIVTGIGAFAGGYFSSRMSKEKGMMYGMICAFTMFVFIFIAGLISVRESITMTTLIRFILMLICGAVGGIIGVNKRMKK